MKASLFEPGRAQELSDRAVTVIRACEAGELLPPLRSGRRLFFLPLLRV